MNDSWWPKLGAALLLVLAGALALTGTPRQLAPVASVEEWGELVASGEDRVDPLTLSEWMIEDKPGLEIIDVRSPQQFARWAIPGSVNLPLEELLSADGLDRLPKSGTLVLVCGNGSRSSEAWVVLRGLGYDALTLEGGAQRFVEVVLEGKTGSADPDLAMKVFALREHLLGGSAALGAAPPPAPAPAAPAVKKTHRKKKKSGGC